MRLVTYRARDGEKPRAGIVDGDRVIDAGVDGGMAALVYGTPSLDNLRRLANSGGGAPIGDVRLLAPLPEPRRNIVCVGLNYAEHVAESKSVTGADAPKYPVFFTKPFTYSRVARRLGKDVRLMPARCADNENSLADALPGMEGPEHKNPPKLGR